MRAILLVMALSLVIGCDDETSPDSGAGTDAGSAGVDAGGDTDGGRADAGPGGADAGPGIDACVGETDAELCAGASAECGTVSVNDRCGASRTASCGDCPGGQTCGARGVANACDYEDWDVTTADAMGDPGHDLSMVIDGDEVPWIAYRAEGGTNALRVAYYAGGAWTVETLDTGALVAVDTAIAIAPGPTLTVAAPGPVRSGTASYVELWTRTGSDSWTMRPTATGSSTSVDLAFDAAGRAQLCAYDPPSSGFGGFLVHLAEQPGGAFTNTTIDGSVASTSRHGDSCTIAVDASGALHTAYEDGQFMRLKYATLPPAGSWTPEVVDEPSGDSAGDYAFMRLDPSGVPHIVYRALSIGGREIRHAVAGSSGWTIETIEANAGTIANYPSVAFDSAGDAHVVYFDAITGGTFYYATNATGSWVREVLDVVGTGSGGFSAIGVDSSDRVHVAFYDTDMQRLRHAVRR